LASSSSAPASAVVRSVPALSFGQVPAVAVPAANDGAVFTNVLSWVTVIFFVVPASLIGISLAPAAEPAAVRALILVHLREAAYCPRLAVPDWIA
jgi:hypothetical protein